MNQTLKFYPFRAVETQSYRDTRRAHDTHVDRLERAVKETSKRLQSGRPVGIDVTDMSDEEFLALLKR